MTKVKALEPLFEMVATLENAHVSFTLLKFCLGVCKINYLLRVTPVQCTKLGAQLFDKFLENGLRTIVGGMLDYELFLELQLPANGGPNCEDPTLGLGFTSAITTAASAFLTSAASSNDQVDVALGDQTPHRLTTYEAAQQTYETWSAQCE